MPAASHPRLLFCSWHCFFDPSSGAALANRDLLELLAGRGWPCRVFCGPKLDYECGESLPQLLTDHGIPYQTRTQMGGSAPWSLLHFTCAGVPVTVYRPGPMTGSSQDQALATFVLLLERVLEQFRPDVLLTYGGGRLGEEIIAQAKRRGSAVVFALHNFAYGPGRLFREVDAMLVPSRFAREHYVGLLSRPCQAIPSLGNWARILCDQVEGRYLTFVNPQPDKGVFVFARIAAELGACGPDIPLLVVEGRGKADWVAGTGLGPLSNLHVMDNTPDPRDFYRVSRAVLMPSVWRESFGRVAAEALINGIPVLGSWRGALPEVLAEAGFLLDIPERYTPDSRIVPAAAEVQPWVDAVLRLWDNPAFYEAEQRRCRAAAEAWRPERLADRFEEFFTRVAAGVFHDPGSAGPTPGPKL